MMSNYLSEDLIVEIFTRLPTKSLLRFRSISKYFCSCIDSPNFIRLHSTRSVKKLMILHQSECMGEGLYYYIYTLHSERQLSSCSGYTDIRALEYPCTDFDIVGSCNGILCLFEWKNGIRLWNPSIRRLQFVHDPTALSHPPYYQPLVGFGYDSSINDYKIVKITQSRIEGAKTLLQLHAFVYNMKTENWCEIASPTIPYNYAKTRCPCLFNGTLHWVVKRYLSGQIKLGPSYCFLMTFHLSTQVFETIELPERNWQTVQVTIIKGCLGVISSKHGTTCIWVRREDNNTSYWSLVSKLDTNEFCGVELALQLTDNGDLIYATRRNGLQAYNPDEKKQRLKLAEFNHIFHVAEMIICVESLELLKSGWGLHSREANQLNFP